MPQHHAQGLLPQAGGARLARPEGGFYFEHVIGTGREASLLYRLHSPLRITQTEELSLPRRRLRLDMADSHNLLFELNRVPPGGDFVDARHVMAVGDHLFFSVARPRESMDSFYRNSLADELVLVVQGAGTLHSTFGDLAFGELDVLYVPRGDVVRWAFEPGPRLVVVLESVEPVSLPPDQLAPDGGFREAAPWRPEHVRLPQPRPAVDEQGQFAIDMKLENRVVRMFLGHHPHDVVGWLGRRYPYALNLRGYAMPAGGSGPLRHRDLLFTTAGTTLSLITPQRLPAHRDVAAVRPFHQSLDYDEIVYRFGAAPPEAGAFTLHPRGLDHGPDDGLIDAAGEAWGIMIDTRDRLVPTDAAMQASDDTYTNRYLQERAGRPESDE